MMRLSKPLLRLPIRFDAARLAREVDALPAGAWTAHPDRIPGNAAVRLITPDGGMTEGTTGRMAPTPFLDASHYMKTVLASIGAVWGRSRLMRLAPGAVVPPHVDTNFYWRKHVRVHVPIVTTPEVLFTCDGETVHMAAGECWIFDTFARHQVRNGGNAARVHLVADTVGDEHLWDLVNAPGDALPIDGDTDRPLQCESGEARAVMSPWELKYHVAFIAERARSAPALPRVIGQLERFSAQWTGIWARHGDGRHAEPEFRRAIAELEDALLAIDGGTALTLRNELPLYRQVAELVYEAQASLAAITPELAPA